MNENLRIYDNFIRLKGLIFPVKAYKPDRFKSIDVIRGLAMVLVIYAHSLFVLDIDTIPSYIWFVLEIIRMGASVCFMFISGSMISYFFYSGKNIKDIQRKYFKRALLLLFIAHPFIQILSYPRYSEDFSFSEYLFYHIQITDTIALSIIIAPIIFKYVADNYKKWLVFFFLITALIVVHLPKTSVGWITFIREFLYGPVLDDNYTYLMMYFPLIPWLGIFISGSYLGKYLSKLKNSVINIKQFIIKMIDYSKWLISLLIIYSIFYKVIKVQYGEIWSETIFSILYPQRTSFLLLGYIGVIFIIVAFLFNKIDYNGKYNRLEWAISVFGRTSLFTFVSHFFITWSIPKFLGIENSFNGPVFFFVFILMVVICWIISYFYGRLRGWIKPKEFKLVN